MPALPSIGAKQWAVTLNTYLTNLQSQINANGTSISGNAASITSLNSTTATNTANIATLTTQSNATLSAWTLVTPTLTNISLGTGSVSAAYIQIGKTVRYVGQFAAGATTTYSAGNLGISLPVTPHTLYTAGAAAGWVAVGSAIIAPTLASSRQTGTAAITTGGILNFLYSGNTTGADVATSVLPTTWSNTGVITFTVVYESI